jgi:hypothetical protein
MQPNSTGASLAGFSQSNGVLLVDYPGYRLQAGAFVGQTLKLYVSINGTISIGVNIITNQIIKVVWDGTKWNQAF